MALPGTRRAPCCSLPGGTCRAQLLKPRWTMWFPCPHVASQFPLWDVGETRLLCGTWFPSSCRGPEGGRPRTPGHLSARTPGSYGRNLRGLLGGGWAPRSRPSTLRAQEAPAGPGALLGLGRLDMLVVPRSCPWRWPLAMSGTSFLRGPTPLPSQAARQPGPTRSAQLTFSSISGTTNHPRGRATRLYLPFELKRTHPLINGLTLLFIIHENTLLGSEL